MICMAGNKEKTFGRVDQRKKMKVGLNKYIKSKCERVILWKAN